MVGTKKLVMIGAIALLSIGVIYGLKSKTEMTSNEMLCGQHPVKSVNLNESGLKVVTTGCVDEMHVRLKETSGASAISWNYINPKRTKDETFEASIDNKAGKWEIVEIYTYSESGDKEYLYEPNKKNNMFQYESNFNKKSVETTIALASPITITN
ncbi:MAG: hypothetical protein OEZ22_08630 [Spirochaetia bacterium]|nr:hypothetical protein [Spirochaetia bacterium]